MVWLDAGTIRYAYRASFHNEPPFDVYPNDLGVKQNCSLRPVSNPSCKALKAKTGPVHLCVFILDIFIRQHDTCLLKLGEPSLMCFLYMLKMSYRCELLKIKMCPNLWSHGQFLSISPRVKSNLDHHRCFHLFVLVLNFKQLSDIFSHLHLLIMITQWSDKFCWILWNFEKAEESPNLPKWMNFPANDGTQAIFIENIPREMCNGQN